MAGAPRLPPVNPPPVGADANEVKAWRARRRQRPVAAAAFQTENGRDLAQALENSCTSCPNYSNAQIQLINKFYKEGKVKELRKVEAAFMLNAAYPPFLCAQGQRIEIGLSIG